MLSLLRGGVLEHPEHPPCIRPWVILVIMVLEVVEESAVVLV